jgi:hypothetical protein
VKYEQEHWDKLSAMVASGMTAEEIQNHFPDTTEATVRRWLNQLPNHPPTPAA